MIKVIVDFASFKWSPICTCDLHFLYNKIITANVFTKYSHLEILGIEGIIIFWVIVIGKCKSEVD